MFLSPHITICCHCCALGSILPCPRQWQDCAQHFDTHHVHAEVHGKAKVDEQCIQTPNLRVEDQVRQTKRTTTWFVLLHTLSTPLKILRLIIRLQWPWLFSTMFCWCQRHYCTGSLQGASNVLLPQRAELLPTVLLKAPSDAELVCCLILCFLLYFKRSVSR